MNLSRLGPTASHNVSWAEQQQPYQLTEMNDLRVSGSRAALTRSNDKTVVVPSQIFSTRESRIILRK
jgi:hypothetical protein